MFRESAYAEFVITSVFALGAVASAWAWWKKDSTILFLLAAFALGGLAGSASVRSQSQAQEALHRMGAPVFVTMVGKISAVDEGGDSDLPRFTVSSPVIRFNDNMVEFPGRILVTMQPTNNRENSSLPSRGALVSVGGVLQPPRSFHNFFGVDFQQRLARQRIYAVCKATSCAVVRHSDWPLVSRLEETLISLRNTAASVLTSFLPPDEARWTISLLFNDRRVLTAEETTSLRNSNMFHLFAVSGLHVGALAGIVLMIFRTLRFSWRAAWLCACIIVWFYVTAIGFVPSAVRAATMLTAYGASYWFRREVDSLNALSLGCFAILLWEPLYLWEPGFLLSAGGVLGIVVFFPLLKVLFPDRKTDIHENGRGARFIVLFNDALRVSLAVCLILLPLQLYYFQQVNVLALIANGAATALCGPIVAAGITTVAAGTIMPQLGIIAGSATAALMDLLMVIVHVTAAQDWAIVRIPQPPLWSVLVYYIFLATGYYVVQKDSPEFVPKARARLVLHFMAALLPIVLATGWKYADPNVRIWFFDVGQGDSILVQLPGNQSVLVDTGSGIPNIARLVLEPQLRALGCYPLDYLLLTHEDSDHTGSAPYLLEDMPVKTVVVSPYFDVEKKLFIRNTYSRRKPTVVRVASGYQKSLGRELEVEILNPDRETSGTVLSENDRSVVLLLRYKRFTCLLTGDAESATESSILARGITNCDVLKVGHHGSASSSSEAFLKALSPSVAVISCGAGNSFGHPHPAVMQRLSSLGVTVYRTDLHGAIAIRTDGSKFTVLQAH